MRIGKRLRCWIFGHTLDQARVSNKSEPFYIERRLIGGHALQTGESSCLCCLKGLIVFRIGFFGPGSDLGKWKAVTRNDALMIQELKLKYKKNNGQ